MIHSLPLYPLSPHKGFEPGFEDPITGTPVTIVMKVPISDPDSPTYVPPPAGEFPPTPVITINDVDTTGFNPLTQEFTYPDPETGTEKILKIDPNNQGVIFEDGTTFQRIDDDECQVQNNVAACTNALIHDTLICANGDGISVCNVNAEVCIQVTI